MILIYNKLIEICKQLRKRQYIDEKDEAKYLVIFKLAKELPLIGEGT